MKVINTVRLIFAGIWLLSGVAILAYQTTLTDSEWGTVQLLGVRFSIGWLAVLFGAYNLFRWWSTRNTIAQKKREQELLEAREARWRSRPSNGSPPTPDPNFDFTSPPADKDATG